MRKNLRIKAVGLAMCAALVFVLGCRQERTGQKRDDKSAKGKHDHGDHGAGPHGGAVGDWGGGKYHFEFKPDHDKKEATVWILGSDEKTPVPIKAKDGQLSATVTGLKNKETFEVVLKANPQKGDPEGKASRFTGMHEKLGFEQELEGTVSGEADGTPYTGDFKEEPPDEKK